MGESPFKVFRTRPQDIKLAHQTTSGVNQSSPINEAAISIYLSFTTYSLLLAVKNEIKSVYAREALPI